MARKVVKKKAPTVRRRRHPNYSDYQYLLIPASIGGVIAWVLSSSLSLGITIFLALLVGNWIGSSLLKK